MILNFLKCVNLGHGTLAIKVYNIFYFFFNYPKANLRTWVRLDITVMIIVIALVWGWTYSLIRENLTIYIYNFLKVLFNFKVSGCSFLSNFYFSPNDSPSKIIKMFFISSKKFFVFLYFFPFLSAHSRFKRTNGSGIIYDAMNWLA